MLICREAITKYHYIHKMFGEQDKEVLSLAQDYKLHLIEPSKIKEDDFGKFHSSLREVLHLIKFAKDADKFQELINSDDHFDHLGREEMDVLNACMNMGLKTKESETTVSACLAIETLKERAREKGREEGREEAREETLMNNIKSLTINLGFTLEQAMNALQIPEEDQEKFRVML